MLKYIFKILLLTLPFISLSQNKLDRQFFIRPGIDLSRFALDLLNDKQFSAIEFNIDSEIKYRFFPTIEFGSNKLTDITDTYEYKSEGTYFRAGLNYNMLNYRQRFDRNIFFIGFRFATSNFSHEAPLVKFSNDWGTIESSFEKRNLNAQWFEGVMGIKGEIIKNMYLGFTFRVKQQLNHSDFDGFTPYWIPGFGKGALNRVVGMSYSLSYAIPIKNPKPDLPEKD